jgi:hypothetical protein
MCVLAGMIVFLIGGTSFFSLIGAIAPGFLRVGGPVEAFHRQDLLAQTSGGIRTSCY